MAIATKLSRTNPTRGSITPPLPFAAEHGLLGDHPLDDVDLAHGRPVDRAAAVARQYLGGHRRREVDHDRSPGLLQPPTGGQGQRQLLADVTARLVDDRQPIGVRVLGETDRRPDGRHDRARTPGDSPRSAPGG